MCELKVVITIIVVVVVIVGIIGAKPVLRACEGHEGLSPDLRE